MVGFRAELPGAVSLFYFWSDDSGYRFESEFVFCEKKKRKKIK